MLASFITWLKLISLQNADWGILRKRFANTSFPHPNVQHSDASGFFLNQEIGTKRSTISSQLSWMALRKSLSNSTRSSVKTPTNGSSSEKQHLNNETITHQTCCTKIPRSCCYKIWAILSELGKKLISGPIPLSYRYQQIFKNYTNAKALTVLLRKEFSPSL